MVGTVTLFIISIITVINIQGTNLINRFQKTYVRTEAHDNDEKRHDIKIHAH